MKRIELSGNKGAGQFAVVDDEDFDKLSAHKWNIHSNGYASMSKKINGHPATIMMHRVIVLPGVGMQVDHINKNRLDNRRCNLREVTPSQNSQNSRKRITGKHDFKGVSFCKKRNRWFATCRVGGQYNRSSPFKTQEEAGAEYDRMSKRLHGEYSYK